MEKFENLSSYRLGCRRIKENPENLFSNNTKPFKNYNKFYGHSSDSSIETPYDEYKSLSPSMRNISKTSWSSEDKSSSSKDRSTKKQFLYNFPSPRSREIEPSEISEAQAVDLEYTTIIR